MVITSADCYKYTQEAITESLPEIKCPFYLRAKQLMIEIAEKTIELYLLSDSPVVMFSIPSACVSDKACQEFREEYEDAGWIVHFDEAMGYITVILSTKKLEG